MTAAERAVQVVQVDQVGPALWRVVLVAGEQRSTVLELAGRHAAEAYADWVRERVLVPALEAHVVELLAEVELLRMRLEERQARPPGVTPGREILEADQARRPTARDVPEALPPTVLASRIQAWPRAAARGAATEGPLPADQVADYRALGRRQPTGSLGRLVATLDQVLEALQVATDTLQSWHAIGLGRSGSETEATAWALYQASPEMRVINRALALRAGAEKGATDA